VAKEIFLRPASDLKLLLEAGYEAPELLKSGLLLLPPLIQPLLLITHPLQLPLLPLLLLLLHVTV
jgi:hypothetical protein